METRERIDLSDLALPDELAEWVGDASIYESSGESGAKTVYVDRGGGAYLKIAPCGSLSLAAQMQSYFANKKMSSPVLKYLSADRDYLLTEPLKGEDGTAEKYLSEPKQLSGLFGQTLRLLHEIDSSDCPIKDRMTELINTANKTPFIQTHLDDIAGYIGTARSDTAAFEIKANSGIIKNDVIIHGDYCLPNIILDNWTFTGFIDVADGGVGDRHYDLAWGLWTLNWNLKTPKYGQRFLDAYGWDVIDKNRLRICGLLAGME